MRISRTVENQLLNLVIVFFGFQVTSLAQQLVIEDETFHNHNETFCHPIRIESPDNPTLPVVVSGNSNITYRAGVDISLNPGFETDAFTSGAMFLAKPGVQDFPLEIIEATNVATGHVEQYEKIEFGIYLPQDIQDQIDEFLFGVDLNGDGDLDDPGEEPYTAGINPYDPDQIKVDMILTDPNGNKRTVYGFDHEEFVRQTTVMPTAIEPWSVHDCHHFEHDGYFWGDDRQLGNYHRWRVRFAPNIKGYWTGKVKFEILGVEFNESSCIGFVCDESLINEGFVSISNSSSNYGDRYLRWSDSKDDNPTFFVNSMNAIWPIQSEGYIYPGDYDPPNNEPTTGLTIGHRLESEDHLNYYDGNGNGWLEKMAAGGINTVSIGMLHWSYGVEWGNSDNTNPCSPKETGLGNYHARMRNAWEFDYLLEKVEELEMSMIPMMEIHDHFIEESRVVSGDPSSGNYSVTYKEADWASNPYKELADISDPVDFFDLSKSGANWYKKRLRYIIARWGYSYNILFWELLSEVNNAGKYYKHDYDPQAQSKEIVQAYHDDPTFKDKVDDWFVEMSDYFRDISSSYREHYVTGSFEQKVKNSDIDDFSEIHHASDIISLHKYGYPKKEGGVYRWVNYDLRVDLLKYIRNSDFYFLNKPIYFDEGHQAGAAIDECYLGLYHNTLWSTSIMGTVGNMTSWYWDGLDIAQPNYYNQHKGLGNFMSQINLVDGNYSPGNWRDKGKNLEAFSLVRDDKKIAFGWVNNIRVKWDGKFQSNGQAINTCLENLIAAEDELDFAPANWLWIETVPLGEKFEVHDLLANNLTSNPKYFIVFVNTVDGLTTSSVIDETTNVFGTLKVPLISGLSALHSDVAFVACHEDVFGDKSLPADFVDVLKETLPSFNGVGVFPNPSAGLFSVIVDEVPVEGYTIEILDFMGRLVEKTEEVRLLKSEFSLIDRPNGIYTVNAYIEGTVISTKFVKQ